MLVGKRGLVVAGMVLSTMAIGTMSASADEVKVKSGDTVSVIAERFGTTQDKIVSDNKLKNANLIYVGEKLIVTPGIKSENKVKAPATQTPVETPVVSTVETPKPASNVVKQAPSDFGSGAHYVASRMAEETGVSYAHWRGVIWRESNDQGQIVNPTGHRGYLQISSIHGNTDWSDEGQVQAALRIWNAQGARAWEAW